MPESATVRRLYENILSLSVYRGVLHRPVTAAFLDLLEAACSGEAAALCSRWGTFCGILMKQGGLDLSLIHI